MKKLRILLQSKYLYLFLFLSLFIYMFNYYQQKRETLVSLDSTNFTGIITNIKSDKDLLTLEVKGSEKIIVYYYFKTEKEMIEFNKNYDLGDTIYLEGSFKLPSNNTVPNLFNYKEYLKYKKIYVTMNASFIKKIKNNNNLFYKVKNLIVKHINEYKSKSYLETFILGNKSYIDNYNLSNYQSNGISHLLAISGMHIALLSGFLIIVLKKIMSSNCAFVTTTLFLIFYMFLTGCSASVSRSVLLFTLLTINKILKLEVKTLNLFLITFFALVLINPYSIFDIGFIFSFTISFYLILFQDKLKLSSYFSSLFKVSWISFLVGLPITLYFFYEVNFLSIILNMLFVPFVSFIVFPLSLLTFFMPFLDSLFLLITNFLELCSNFASKLMFLKFTFGRPDFYFIVLYYILLTLFLKSSKKKYFILLILLLIINYNKNMLFPNNYIIMIDVGQGDSILMHSNNKSILIDTGGRINYSKEDWMRESKSLTDSKLIPLLKSFGIKKLDYLILSHGDYDHMGEAINLVNDFKVEKVIFNCGEFNELEQDLIKVLDKRKIPYHSCIKELNIDNNKLYFLQTKEYDNENDNSNVIYTEIDGYKFMFMGDASITTENEILKKYNINNVDVLKVGHHGSKTSSSKDFIGEMNPKYSIISVGKNNRYGHPNKEVLNNLNKSKIYRTDEDGSIMFKIRNSNLKIETCAP